MAVARQSDLSSRPWIRQHTVPAFFAADGDLADLAVGNRTGDEKRSVCTQAAERSGMVLRPIGKETNNSRKALQKHLVDCGRNGLWSLHAATAGKQVAVRVA